MGVLDDAIREHLELKRKHGVPEDEVQRQEEEALGPARREVAQQPEDAGTAAAAADETAPFDGEHGPGAGAEALPAEPDEHAAEAEPPAAAPEPSAEEPFAEGDEPFADAPTVHDSVVDEAPPEPLAPGRPLAEDEELDFAAEELEDEDPDAPEGEHEDVLEDTPDFLQETPEHDRLWFEQKPPRDFDFD
jgi:hypothetical protein